MNFTYNGPDASDKDYIRFRLGDTTKTATSIMDEEIEVVISITSSLNAAVLRCGEAILTKMARRVDYTIGPEKVYASQAYNNFKKSLELIRLENTAKHGVPSAKISKPIFKIGMHDNA